MTKLTPTAVRRKLREATKSLSTARKVYEEEMRRYGVDMHQAIQRCPHENVVATKYGVDCKDCKTMADTREKLGQYAKRED